MSRGQHLTSIEIFLLHHHLRFPPTSPVLDAPFSWIPSINSLYRIFSHEGCHLLTAKILSSVDHPWCRDGIILSGSELSEASCVAEGLLFRFQGKPVFDDTLPHRDLSSRQTMHVSRANLDGIFLRTHREGISSLSSIILECRSGHRFNPVGTRTSSVYVRIYA